MLDQGGRGLPMLAAKQAAQLWRNRIDLEPGQSLEVCHRRIIFDLSRPLVLHPLHVYRGRFPNIFKAVILREKLHTPKSCDPSEAKLTSGTKTRMNIS
jgi:hypothetical protein